MAIMSAPAVELAARILKLLARRSYPRATLTEISSALGAPKSTCLRVLRELEAHSLIDVDTASRKYSLGIYNILLGARAEEGMDYLTRIRRLLSELAQQTSLTAVYAERIDARIVYIAKQDPVHRHSVSVFVGSRFPITGTSLGLWWQVYGPTETRGALLHKFHGGLDEKDLVTFRAERVISSHGEYIPGISMISSPLLSTEGHLVGVLAVIDTVPSLIGDRAAGLGNIVRELAASPIGLS